MKRTYRTYEESLMEDLKDSQEALAYLNAALEDEDQRVFLLALKDVLKAQDIDISAFAQESQLTRQNIYRILSKTGNPRWDSLTSLLQALGLQVYLTRKQPKVVTELFSLDKKLHTNLLRQAAKQGVSLNDLINEKLRK
jgi:probable addiction module antidote protein